ncbi:hypothetical protein BP6252_07560 [Coleophoma cylindrospora]|uniref:Xylanolytic transcriptional activator regulatory domain-containing protein n=1 Tax=Coleophoma cylindrospora TaxID=1849047 RepID=A0A3D8RAC1_9HELO|nr:hypothetical protein BP6252_07560 [Coleophoma cylindrospora]
MPFGKDNYIKALEDRVAELESYLTKEGREDVGSDHWQFIPRSNVSDDGSPTPAEVGSRKNQSKTAVSRAESGASSEEPEDVETGEVDAMIGVLRDLSLDANGGYMGATAHITIGRLVGSIVKGKNSVRASSDISSVKEHLSPSTIMDDEAFEYYDSAFARIPTYTADQMLSGYMDHISTGFPVVHSLKIKDIHSRRAMLDDVYETCILHLVYAIGGRILELTGEMGCFYPERHHAAALKLLDEILQFHDSRSVQALMLLAIYCLRAPQGPGAWTYVGLAIRIAVDLGLHRRTSAMRQVGLDNELRKRLFWSCYNLDRQVSIPLGRPFALSNRDIDVPFPLDVDETTEDIAALEEASKTDSTAACTTSTTLSLFIHVIKLRMIESSVQQTIYRVDSSEEASDDEIDMFSAQLSEWKSTIPLDVQTKYQLGLGRDAYEQYMVHYYQCLRLLLYPQVIRPQVNPRYLKECAEACGGICRTLKSLHQETSVGYSLMALQSVFMAGLTLIYCTWVDPALVFNTTTSNDISACSIVLFVITERWRGARKYRNAFEVIKQNVIDLIAQGKHQGSRRPIVPFKTGLKSTLHSMQGDEDQQNECTRILTDMAGERIALEPEALLPFDSPGNGSRGWKHRSGYGQQPPRTDYISPYQQMDERGHMGSMTTADAQFQRDNLSTDDLGMGDMLNPSGWR